MPSQNKWIWASDRRVGAQRIQAAALITPAHENYKLTGELRGYKGKQETGNRKQRRATVGLDLHTQAVDYLSRGINGVTRPYKQRRSACNTASCSSLFSLLTFTGLCVAGAHPSPSCIT